MSTVSSLRVDVHLAPTEVKATLAADVRQGLTSTPKELPPKWLYDDVGSALFEAITRLDEYYPTRREREILYSEAGAIARMTGADTLVELGSGSGEKTLLLLDALAARGTLRRFVPFDVSEITVRQLAELAADRHRGLEIRGLVGDFERHLPLVPRGGRRLVAFLGGTVGNLPPRHRRRFLTELAATLGPEDFLLLGTDLVKDPRRLEAAYDDAAGVTAAFNRNLLSVLNRELGADFVHARFVHEARFDSEHEWVEMLLRATSQHVVRIPDLALEVPFAEGEAIRTEICAKFRLDGLAEELAEAGLALVHSWTDSHDDFALTLAAPD